jgi:3-hydroxy acid dehydrogenase / malonic semialdehyde reductase
MKAYTLITGASAGIGEATARKLASEGRNLILVARRADRLRALQNELGKVDSKVYTLDVTDHKALEKMFAELKDISIDAVINNAGLAVGRDPFDQYDFQDVLPMIDVNITAFLKVAHLSLPFLKRSKGHLVNLGSIAGIEAYKGGAVYCGTKHFVHAFSRALRHDLLGTGVRITIIAPGNVETEFSVVRYKGDQAKADAIYSGWRHLKSEDIADAISHALNSPAHVDLEQITVMPTDQAGVTVFKP